VNTGFLPVIGLGDIMYHMAMSSRKSSGLRSVTQLCNRFIQGLTTVETGTTKRIQMATHEALPLCCCRPKQGSIWCDLDARVVMSLACIEWRGITLSPTGRQLAVCSGPLGNQMRDNYYRSAFFVCLQRATALTATQCVYASTYYQYLQRVRLAPAALRAWCRRDVQ